MIPDLDIKVEIMMLNNISFTAKYIKSACIQKIPFEDGIPKETKVSCIELDPENNADLDAAFNVAERWNTNEGYPDYIALSMKYPPNEPGVQDRYYALTTQNNNFEIPDPEKIIAISQVNIKDNEAHIEFLQAKPVKTNNHNEPFVYKKVGTAMLDLFKKLFFNKTILLYSRPTAIEFYLKNGFICEDELDPTRMSYKA